MAQIQVNNLTFAYEGSYDNIFKNVSFRLDSSWKLGFIGRNGRGKTTFLKLLMKQYQYSGEVLSGDLKFAYFPYPVQKDGEQTTLEVINSIGGDFQLWQLKKELSQLRVSDDVLERCFATLSNGEQVKILLAVMFLHEDNYLLIDEPTNHLDYQARKLVSKYLNSKNGFIVVSHDRKFLDNCTDHTLSINKNNIEVIQGSFSCWWADKQKKDNFEMAENERLKKEIRRLTAAVRATADWSDKVEKTKLGVKVSGVKPDKGHIGSQAAKMMKRSKTLESRQQQAIEQKSQMLNNIEQADSLRISPLDYHSKRLITLENISLSYGSKTICQAINLTIERSDIIAILGQNGSGKSSVLKLICGEQAGAQFTYTGNYKRGSNLKISYVAQDSSFLSGSLECYIAAENIDESLFKTILRKLGFERVQFEKDMADFSAGQKKKVLLAKSLCEKAHLYVWDEPLNYIDVISRMQVEELLNLYKPTIIFVEHDIAFCDNLANKIIRL